MGDKHYSVRLHLRGVMRDAQMRCDTVELHTQGRMILDESENRVILIYDEDESSGMQDSLTRLVLRDGCVDMCREGDCAVAMHFEKGKQFLSQYQTQHGALAVSVFTNRVLYRVDDRGGKIRLGYVISVENGPSTENTLSIDVQVC